MKRVAKGVGRDRPDCADGCPERLNLELIGYVLSYRKNHRKKVTDHLAAHSHLTVHRFTNPRELEKLFESGVIA